MPMTPPIRTLPAKPATPDPATRVWTITSWLSYPSFEKVATNSALRFTSRVQGVVGQVRPVDVRMAAGGCESKVICSVVPRVTVAQAPNDKLPARMARMDKRMNTPRNDAVLIYPARDGEQGEQQEDERDVVE